MRKPIDYLFFVLMIIIFFAAQIALTYRPEPPPQTDAELHAQVQKLRSDLISEELIRQDLEHRLRVVERRNMINVEAE